MGKNLNKKMGPLPLWAWGAIFGVVGYFVYERYRSSAASSSTSPTAGVLDPNAVDPNTGLTYGQEEDAALNANAAGAVGSDGGTSGGTSPTTGDLGTGTNELADLDQFLQGFGQIATDLGYTPPGVDTNQTIPDVVQPSNGPITKPQVNKQKKPKLTVKGAVRARSGSTKPPARKGYKIKGLGNGNWEYVPDKSTPKETKPPKPKSTATETRSSTRTRRTSSRRRRRGP